jgi:hypothetical protein
LAEIALPWVAEKTGPPLLLLPMLTLVETMPAPVTTTTTMEETAVVTAEIVRVIAKSTSTAWFLLLFYRFTADFVVCTSLYTSLFSLFLIHFSSLLCVTVRLF